jgi:hypothetical protein
MPVAKKQLNVVVDDQSIVLRFDEKNQLHIGRIGDSTIKIKNSVVLEGSRGAGDDVFELRAEYEKDGVIKVTAKNYDRFREDENSYKAFLKANLRVEGNDVVIQSMTSEDVRRFAKFGIKANRFGWLPLEQAKKAQELVKAGNMELCPRCAFTKERLEKVEIFYNELEKAASFAKQAEKIREQLGIE